MAKMQDAFKLLDYYKSKYQARTGKTITINKHALKWGAASVIEDYGLDRSCEVIDYFLKTSQKPSDVPAMFSRFHDIESALSLFEKDTLDRQVQRSRMYEAMKEEGYGG